MVEEELVHVKFRIFDGSDLGPFRYSPASTVSTLKQMIASDWPKGKTIFPRAVHEVKLICSGKILENNRTVGQCMLSYGELTCMLLYNHHSPKSGQVWPVFRDVHPVGSIWKRPRTQ